MACIAFILLIVWLAVMEGGQGCLVGLAGVPKSKYKRTHPLTWKICRIVHRGGHLERFIVGRQFLVVVVIFLMNMMGEAKTGANPLNLPKWINDIFLGNSLAIIITTIDVGQLPAQVNAAVAMLDFIQNYIMLATVYVSLAIELSGLLHCVYLVQFLFNRLAFASGSTEDVDTANKQPQQTTLQMAAFWARVLLSLIILGFAFAVTIQALLLGKSGMGDGVSPLLSIVMFFIMLTIVGLMEGMQIAAFALMNTPEEELLTKSPMAHRNAKLILEGKNLQSFLVGRQIFVASLMFIVARIATIELQEGDENIFGVSNGLQSFLDTGLLGAIMLTVGSLIFRVLASSYPVMFMSNPVLFVIIKACLLLETTGVCSASWLIAIAMRSLFRLKADHMYLDADFAESADEDKPKGEEEAIGKPQMKRGPSLRSRFSKQKSSRGGSVVLSSRELCTNDKDLDSLGLDDLDDTVERHHSSFLRNSRFSAVISTRDIAVLMDEIGPEYGKADGEEEDSLDEENAYGNYQIM
eukprot:CAMPEP_0181098094 /NCGR_PEP_ID=MMETSP1071-20121207/11932_1 /TAXON_ID=35127 /ORGANISM="Thalassiosira sp., Strain NH16" /LENGTH=522 /DNA_ID=CAMNT_0023180645 /DNA_START=156 /DNA_END=1724 /DNA_ORIENTATION=-